MKFRKLNISEISGDSNTIFSEGTLFLTPTNELKIGDGVTEGGKQFTVGGSGTAPRVIYPTSGTGTNGIVFPKDPNGGSGDTASIKYYPVEGEQMVLHINVENDESDEILIDASGSVNLQSNDKLWSFDRDGNLTLPANGDILDSEGNSVLGGGANTGDITFDGISIIGGGTGSGDGSENGTIELVPDSSLKNNDQYIIIDPTIGEPPHIHIRAGGTQDDSNAVLFLGGENSHVKIGEGSNPPVTIASNNNNFIFSTDGFLIFPDGGSMKYGNSVPVSSVGAPGDVEGTIVIASGYIYYCTENYVSHDSTITIDSGGAWGGIAGGLTSIPFSSTERVPEIGWTISGPQNDPPGSIGPLTITSVTPLGGDRYDLGFSNTVMNISNGFVWTLTDDDPPKQIWKRIQWSGDTW